MIDIPNMLERFENLRDVQKFLQTEYISAQFTERDIEDMIHLIKEYVELRQYLEKNNIIEIWNGMHGQTIAPAGTFEKIYNDCKDEEDDI